MNKQHSQLKAKDVKESQTEPLRDGSQAVPPAHKVGGASGGNEPTGRTAVEVEDFYTGEEMQEHADEVSEAVNTSKTTDDEVFNPVVDSEDEVTE